MVSAEHRCRVDKVHGLQQWQTRCPICGVLSMDVTRELADAAAAAHFRARNPAAAGPAEPPDPEHGERTTRRMAKDWSLRIECYCGQRWTGPAATVRALLAEHLAQWGTKGGPLGQWPSGCRDDSD